MTFVTKLGGVFLMLMNSFWGCASNSFFTTWMSMELNLLIFLPMMLLGGGAQTLASTVKYMVIQSVSGLMVIISFSSSYHSAGGGVGQIFMTLVLLFKLGGFPFIQWVLSVGSTMDWFSLTVMLTVQKIMPMNFMANSPFKSAVFLGYISWGLLPILTVKAKLMKTMIILSSTFSLMAIIVSLSLSFYSWKYLLSAYTLMSLPMMLLAGISDKENNSIKTLSPKILTTYSVVLMISMMGLPPSPGFFFKLAILLHLLGMGELLGMVMFALGSGGMILAYLAVIILNNLSTRVILAPSYLNPVAPLSLGAFFMSVFLML